MSRKCILTGKGPLVGNNVSHANNKTKKRQLPNILIKRIFVPELNQFIRVRLSARALRTVAKLGLAAYCAKVGLTIKDVRY